MHLLKALGKYSQLNLSDLIITVKSLWGCNVAWLFVDMNNRKVKRCSFYLLLDDKNDDSCVVAISDDLLTKVNLSRALWYIAKIKTTKGYSISNLSKSVCSSVRQLLVIKSQQEGRGHARLLLGYSITDCSSHPYSPLVGSFVLRLQCDRVNMSNIIVNEKWRIS